jgi:hypothetical protein
VSSVQLISAETTVKQKTAGVGYQKVRDFSALFDFETIVNRLTVFHFRRSYLVLLVLATDTTKMILVRSSTCIALIELLYFCMLYLYGSSFHLTGRSSSLLLFCFLQKGILASLIIALCNLSTQQFINFQIAIPSCYTQVTHVLIDTTMEK